MELVWNRSKRLHETCQKAVPQLAFIHFRMVIMEHIRPYKTGNPFEMRDIRLCQPVNGLWAAALQRVPRLAGLICQPWAKRAYLTKHGRNKRERHTGIHPPRAAIGGGFSGGARWAKACCEGDRGPSRHPRAPAQRLSCAGRTGTAPLPEIQHIWAFA